MKNFQNSSISEIVSQNPGSVKVFEKYNIDFCCNGKLKFEEACQRAQVSEEIVVDELNRSISDALPALVRAQHWPLSLLANYIVQNHHAYIKKVAPEIFFLLIKVVKAHGAKHPELIDIRNQFQTLIEELETHMYKEESILFPSVLELEKENKNNLGFRLMYPVDVMEKEHEEAGQCLYIIRQLSNNYTLPEGVCNSFKLLYQRLREFDEDLHIHIHLENNILFPKALHLEERILEVPVNPN